MAALCRPIQAQAVSKKVADFLELCESSRRGAILHVEHQLRGKRNTSPQTREEKAEIAGLEAQLRILRSNAKPVVPQLPFPPQIGSIGRLPGLTFHVEQVLADDQMLGRCDFPIVVRTVKNFASSGQTVIESVRFVIRGLPAKETQEGSDRPMPEVFEVAGKHTFKTVGGGSEDLLVLSPFDMRPVEDYYREQASRKRR